MQSAARLNGQAEHTLELAVVRFPGDPETWTRLARFQLADLDHPRAALRTRCGAHLPRPLIAAGARALPLRQAAQRVLEREPPS